MNIRPFTDALRRELGGWHRKEQSQFDKERVVQIFLLFRGKSPRNDALEAHTGDRYLRVQMWERGGHSVDHMVVTCDCPVSDQGPTRLRGTTKPTPFSTPDQMLAAITTELDRQDHKL